VLTGRGDGRETLKAGDVWSSLGRHEYAGRLWSRAMDDPAHRTDAMLRHARAAKRNGDYAAAREHFSSALAEMERSPLSRAERGISVSVLEELAKIEEHRFAAFHRALGHVESALAILRKRSRYEAAEIGPIRAMEHRRARLLKKIMSSAAEPGADEERRQP
jgi:tetratricopeptide (TPR) repeat protein